MIELWRRIEGVLAGRAVRSEAARERLSGLRGGVDAAEVAAAEGELGGRLPEELRQSLAVHDGQDPGALEVFGTWGLHSLGVAMRTWRMFNSMVEDGVIGRGEWDSGWLPIAANGGGDYLLIDLRCGEVLRYRRASSSGPVVVAGSLREWLEERLERLPPEEDEE